MRSQIALSLALASSVFASPLEDRAFTPQPICGDPCYNQVHSNQLLGSQHSKPGCQQLYQSTIYPCTVTTTSSVFWTNFAYEPCGPSQTTITESITETTITTATTDLTILAGYKKRAPVTPVAAVAPHPTTCTPQTKSTTAVPSYFNQCKNIQQYQSACSCLHSTGHGSTITEPTPTTTTYHIGCTTTTSTVLTTDATVFSATATATVTFSAPVCAQTVTATAANGNTNVYNMNYHGSGLITDPNAAQFNSDPNHPPIISYLSDFPNEDDGDNDNDCAVIQECANDTFGNDNEYYMFDLHYDSQDGWVCVQYYQGTGDSSNFNNPDPNAEKVYGYEIAFYG